MVTRIISKDTPRAKKLLEILDSHTDDEKQIERALKIINSGKNIQYATNKSRKLMEVAWKKAQKIIPDGPAKNDLEKLSKFLIERNL